MVRPNGPRRAVPREDHPLCAPPAGTNRAGALRYRCASRSLPGIAGCSALTMPAAPRYVASDMTSANGTGYHVDRVDLADGKTALRFAGELRFRQCFASWQNVR